MKRIALYDTTLRDGCQSEDVSFTLEDKLRIAEKLDDFGITYIEGGWPGSNPRDEEFFSAVKKLHLKHARVAAFGSTRRANISAAEDFNIRLLLKAETPTCGGRMPHEILAATRAAAQAVTVPLGIHCHNDGEMAVANSLAGVEGGAVQVQGTINGFGERCGNANLCSVIPNLQLKFGYHCVSSPQLKQLAEISRFVYELANIEPHKRQAYVGVSAFAHKGGLHVAAVQKNRETYEHIDPELVGNAQRVLVSDLSGRSNVVYKAKQFGLDVESSDPAVKTILDEVKRLENVGFQYEGAEGSFELLMQKAINGKVRHFRLIGFRVIDEKRKEDEPPLSEATIMVEGPDGAVEHTAAQGNGPVNALDRALRKALTKFYPQLEQVVLHDYKVRVLGGDAGTGATVRVLIESGDEHDRWGTVGVSPNVIEASWQALVDSIEYKLYKDKKHSAVSYQPSAGRGLTNE